MPTTHADPPFWAGDHELPEGYAEQANRRAVYEITEVSDLVLSLDSPAINRHVIVSHVGDVRVIVDLPAGLTAPYVTMSFHGWQGAAAAAAALGDGGTAWERDGTRGVSYDVPRTRDGMRVEATVFFGPDDPAFPGVPS